MKKSEIKTNKSYTGNVVFTKDEDGKLEIRTRVYERGTESQSKTVFETVHGALKVTNKSLVANFKFDTKKLNRDELVNAFWSEVDDMCDAINTPELDAKIAAAREELAAKQESLKIKD